MKIFVYSARDYEKSFLEKASQNKHVLEYTSSALDASTAQLSKGFSAIMLFTSDDASEEVLEKLYENGIRFIALRSVGHDHINLEKVKQLGIIVANVPAYSPNAVAEHAVALLMALNRKIILGHQLMKKKDFRLDELIGFDLNGKTVGVVGTGKIGSVFATIMKGFGCNLIGYDEYENINLIQQTQIKYKTLEELCKESDIISLHCPLTPETKYLFNKNTFSIMKKGVFFINTARGSIVNTVDLIEALENNIVAAAGLDVYENEKNIFFKNHLYKLIDDEIFNKLCTFTNVIITGHQGFLTNEALSGIAKTTFENINNWERIGKSNNDL
jgi:D-lactate dehydrogenase